MKKNRNYEYLMIAAAVAVITFLVYLPALQNGFVEWDDNDYVFENAAIHSLDLAFFKWAFFDFYCFNWHPLTWVSHALDYSLWGLNPLGHHLTSIVLHAVNSFLVVILACKLLVIRRASVDSGLSALPGRWAAPVAAGATGLLFGVHPLHVESVAWIAERKDLLCGFFFLLSIIAYLEYGRGAAMRTDDRKSSVPWNRRYFISLGLFFLALLSKPMAVTLPLVLLILDWHPLDRIRSRKAFWSALGEKAPFLLLSLGSSVLTILAQKSGGAVRSMVFAPVSTRLLVAARSLVLYVVKMLLPVNLIPWYPYPKTASLASAGFLLPALLVFGAIAGAIAIARVRPGLSAVWAYYAVTLVPVLGIVQVGGQAMADRYTYLPSLGPFLLIGTATAGVLQSAGSNGLGIRRIGSALAVLVFVFLSALTVRQAAVWKNSIRLWDYVIEKEPGTFSTAYLNRGVAYERIGQFAFALRDYDEALALDPLDFEAYYNRGVALEKIGRFDEAIENFSRAIALNQNDTQMLVARGLLYLNVGRPGPGIADLARACQLGDSFGCQAVRVPAVNRAGAD